jgi:serine/threonine-protein kinase HipA
LGIERIELKFLWEAVALQLAAKAGINTPKNQLLPVAGKAVLLSHRFDRAGDMRVPFLSAMTIMGMKDGERGSYPELVDALAQLGAQVASECANSIVAWLSTS